MASWHMSGQEKRFRWTAYVSGVVFALGLAWSHMQQEETWCFPYLADDALGFTLLAAGFIIFLDRLFV